MKHTTALLCVSALLLAACGGGDSAPSNPSNPPAGNAPAPPPPPPPPGTIGPAGGIVSGPAGSQVVIPAGALAQDVVIGITQSSTGAPALPAPLEAAGEMFELTPHGTSFAAPVSVTIPFDPALIPGGEAPLLYKTTAAGWEPVANATVNGATMTGSIDGFSWILVSRLPPPIDVLDEPKRFYEFMGWNLSGQPLHLEGTMNFLTDELDDPAPPGIFEESYDFGGLSFEPQGGDHIANGEVYSNADGKTYWVEVEAPNAELLARNPDETIVSSASRLRLDQSYRKNSSAATMEIVITQANLELADFNGTAPRTAGCPWLDASGNQPTDCNDTLDASVIFSLQVLKGSQREADAPVGRTDMYSSLVGSATLTFGKDDPLLVAGNPWRKEFTNAVTDGLIIHTQHRPVFLKEHFVVTDLGQGVVLASLIEPLRINVDLSNVPSCFDPYVAAQCPEFTVRTRVAAIATNRRAAESYARAKLRDPVNLGGPVEVITTGLTPTNRPLADDTLIELDEQPVCLNGTRPEAGTVQFSSPTYRIMEFGHVGTPLLLTRSGGSEGDVVVAVTARDVSARAGRHFKPYTQSFRFTDGDDTARVLHLEPLDNQDNDGNIELELVLSAEPNCATLGSPNVARVTLIDDEARPTPNTSPSGTLDETFGAGGKVDLASFGGDQTRMARQPDGSYVIVGGNTVYFHVARFTTDGKPDLAFGDGGRVSTNITGSFYGARARAVAIQPDGRIVVAGEANTPSYESVMALARYNTDGTLDTTFGGGDGLVYEEGPAGRAFAVAIQPDGRIVVAGDFAYDNGPDYADIAVARFTTDGILDPTFATGGVHVFDVNNVTNLARNVVIQTNGAIVVSGHPIGDRIEDQTAIARLDASGQLDAGFGNGGTVAIATARLGRGLALQTDGKLLLAGGTVGFPSSFALARLDTDGNWDSTFGNGGAVTTSVSQSTSGAGDLGTAVAVRADGRIYVAGIVGSINQDFGLARFTAAGALDTSFAGTGSVRIDFNGLPDGAEDVAIQPDGKIVLGGYATPTANDGFALARVHP